MNESVARRLSTQGVSAVEDILADYRQGGMVIVVDDADRENEGDLVMAAERVRTEDINFMAVHARGLVCLTLTEEHCRRLGLPLMVQNNNARFSTNFTVSIEAAAGVTTGISAADRATTVQTAVQPDAKPTDIVTPGHIFPIMARPGGVLTRAGHTEAGVDLAHICGFQPASVICEILKPDGSMARLPDLIEFGHRHGLKIGTIADLIKYRVSNEPTVKRIGESVQATRYGNFQVRVYEDLVGATTHIALIKGPVSRLKPTLVRVHLHYGPCDVLSEARGEHAWSTLGAIRAIAAADSGVVVLLDYHIGRHELLGRLHSSSAMDKGVESTGETEHDLRVLGAGGQILADIGVGKMRVLGAPRRAHALSGFGLEVVEYIADPTQS